FRNHSDRASSVSQPYWPGVRSSMAADAPKSTIDQIHAQEETPSHIIVVGFSARFGE
ncbi:hypothetical protein AVEN_99268-1, partial [Araneus ventricosus]